MDPAIYPLFPTIVVSNQFSDSEQTVPQRTGDKPATSVASSILGFFEEAASAMRDLMHKKQKAPAASEGQSSKKIYIDYTKGKIATSTIVPTKKGAEGLLGRGTFGRAYVHGNDEDRVVKKVSTHPTWAPTIEELSVMVKSEFEIGATLEHPNIIKYRQFITKHYPDQQIKMKLVMDRIYGKTLEEHRESKAKMSREDFLKVLNQAKDACVHVFNHGIAWGDVSDKNVYITDDNQLMLSDFGYWSFHPNATDRAKKLLLGSMEMVEWLTRLSPLNALDRETLHKIKYPEDFFHLKLQSWGTQSFEPGTYDCRQWMKNVIEAMRTYDDTQKIKVVELYWDHVMSQFSQLA